MLVNGLNLNVLLFFLMGQSTKAAPFQGYRNWKWRTLKLPKQRPWFSHMSLCSKDLSNLHVRSEDTETVTEARDTCQQRTMKTLAEQDQTRFTPLLPCIFRDQSSQCLSLREERGDSNSLWQTKTSRCSGSKVLQLNIRAMTPSFSSPTLTRTFLCPNLASKSWMGILDSFEF